MDEIRKIPLITRSLLGGILLITIPIMLNLTSFYAIAFIPKRITIQFEIWRILTSFCYAGKGIPLVFDLFMLFKNSSELEERHFLGKSAEYAWALIIICSSIIATNIPLESVVFFRPLLIGISHLWAQTNATAQVSLFGLINVPAPYFPWFLIFLDFVQGGNIPALRSFTGLASAHLYYFLSVIYPRQNDERQLSFLFPAPQFLVTYLGNGTPPPPPVAPAANSNAPYRAGGGWGFKSTGTPLGAKPGSGGGIGNTSQSEAGGSKSAGREEGMAGSSAREGGVKVGQTSLGYRWGGGNRLGSDE